MKKLKVFLSKKETDEIATRRIKSKLALYGADKLEFIVSQDIPPGTEWIEWIKQALKEADILFLFFTNPKTSWDWCLYEVGMFTPLSDRPEKPIICFHNPAFTPPEPLKHLQAVKGDVDSVKEFIKDFYGGLKITKLDSPINITFAEDDKEVTSVSEYICERLSPPDAETIDRIYYSRYMDLIVDRGKLSKKEIPLETEVKADALSLEIFGLIGSPSNSKWYWGALLDRMLSGDDVYHKEWIDELTENVYEACQNHHLVPSRKTLRSLTSNKEYRAVIHHREKISEHFYNIRVLFIHLPSDSQGKTAPADEQGRVPRSS